MKLYGLFSVVCLAWPGISTAAPVSLFDGESLRGWSGDTESVWRVRDGVIVGGSMDGNPQNEFLATVGEYKNFHLRLEYRIVGTEGFVNGGVQFRSKRSAQPANEMEGYQADIGAGYSGFLYDESRRRKFVAQAEKALVETVEKVGEWNAYEIVAEGAQVSIFLNGQRTLTYVEREAGIADRGLIALQIHGNCKAEISFRNITIEELAERPVAPQGEIFRRFGEGQPGLPLAGFEGGVFSLEENEVVALVGQENLVREQKAGEMEALLAAGLASKSPRFRPMAWEADTVYSQWRDLNFGDWAGQLEVGGVTMVVAQFGQMEALDGTGRLAEFVASYHRLLDEFAKVTRRVVLVSPMPFEKPSAVAAPDLRERNPDVAAYVEAVREVARVRGAVFVDVYTPLVERGGGRLTEDGIHLTQRGLREVGFLVADALGAVPESSADLGQLREAIVQKNRFWFDCWRPANWSFVYGDRVSQLYGKGGGSEPTLQAAFERQLPLVAAADGRIAALAKGEEAAEVEVPVREVVDGPVASSPEEEMAKFTVAEGYAVNLFASEADGVVNPVQFSWDERGRLYVACSPSYPQTLASAEPGDYVLVLEDTDGDGRADRSWRFAEGLTMVQGVEPGGGGVYVCDFDQLLHFRDTDGDGKADERRVVFSGFGIGDTHQLINSICHGPDGSLWFTQGLHAMSRVETPWGIARLDRAAVWRMEPKALRLEGFFGGGMAGANCWGVAFDDYGQVFHKTGDRAQGYWTVPGMVRGADPRGSSSETEASASYAASPEQYHSVGALFNTSPKTTALDIIGTAALPDEVQGCALIGGYFGGLVELHRFEDAGSGFKTEQLPRLMTSEDKAFRPVDVGVGPDGGIYLADWYNPVIGHYQVSYADPRRDKAHGRIWRVTAVGREAVVVPDLAAMGVTELLGQLRSGERWVRGQAKRLLFDGDRGEVVAAADAFVGGVEDERVLLEVCGVFEAHGAVRLELVRRLVAAEDGRVRAYGARVAGKWGMLPILRETVSDGNARVRLESVVAASYVEDAGAVEVVAAALDAERDGFLDYAMRASARALQGWWAEAFVAGELEIGEAGKKYLGDLLGEVPAEAPAGEELYGMACLACHQPGGKGLPGVYPALEGSGWVGGEVERLIKVVLHGLEGKTYPGGEGAVPMPAMGGLTDQQVADVLSYVREEFGGGAAAVSAEQVGRVRAATSGRVEAWNAGELE